MDRLAALVLATPGCLLAIASMATLVLTAFDQHPLWPSQSTNLAETAGVRDEAEVVRLIQRGQDPNARYDLRPGLIFEFPISLTPLEVGVAVGDALMVDRLLASGAAMDTSTWNRLRCITEREDVTAILDRNRPAGAELHC